jgi:hypothetical protein
VPFKVFCTYCWRTNDKRRLDSMGHARAPPPHCRRQAGRRGGRSCCRAAVPCGGLRAGCDQPQPGALERVCVHETRSGVAVSHSPGPERPATTWAAACVRGGVSSLLRALHQSAPVSVQDRVGQSRRDGRYLCFFPRIYGRCGNLRRFWRVVAAGFRRGARNFRTHLEVPVDPWCKSPTPTDADTRAVLEGPWWAATWRPPTTQPAHH